MYYNANDDCMMCVYYNHNDNNNNCMVCVYYNDNDNTCRLCEYYTNMIMLIAVGRRVYYTDDDNK